MYHMGTLSIVATPIGNLEDISLRALKVLFTADVIACEDTRRAGSLLHELGVRYPEVLIALGIDAARTPRFIRYDDHTEQQGAPEIIALVENGSDVALISDAGTPLINDPGYVLVNAARKRGIPVIGIPGASAILTALTVSGLPANTFTYLGYPPEKQGNRVRLLHSLKEIATKEPTTFVFYVSPHKLWGMLADMDEVFGESQGITVARELTKRYEEVWTGSVKDAQTHFAEPKGEFVLLFRR